MLIFLYLHHTSVVFVRCYRFGTIQTLYRPTEYLTYSINQY